LARASAFFLAGLVVLLAAAAAPGARYPGPGCGHWASSGGSDGNPRTQAAPFRTVGRLLASLTPGETGCLAAGSRFAEHLVVARAGTRRAPVRIRTFGSPRAVISGRVTVASGGHDFILASVGIEGDGSPARAIVTIRGSRVTLVRSTISGPGYLDRRIACVQITGQAWNVVLDHVNVRTCTRASSSRVRSSGIVVAHAHNTQIRDSFVSHIAGDGIVLAPDSQRTRITRTIVDGNVAAVFIGGGKKTASSGNVISNSILSYSGKWHVHSLWNRRVGSGNVVTGNCLWQAFRKQLAGKGFSAYGNLVASPRYVNRPASLSVRPGRCYAKRPTPISMSVTNLGLRWPKLARFTVHYAVRALPMRVQVVRLRMTGLRQGSPVEVRCHSGCRLRESLRVGKNGTVSSVRMPGLWLRRGAVLEVRERRSGWVGSFARVVVTGLPRGVAIDHACMAPLEQNKPLRCGMFP
jgi:Right handed beta helix region